MQHPSPSLDVITPPDVPSRTKNLHFRLIGESVTFTRVLFYEDPGFIPSVCGVATGHQVHAPLANVIWLD